MDTRIVPCSCWFVKPEDGGGAALAPPLLAARSVDANVCRGRRGGRFSQPNLGCGSGQALEDLTGANLPAATLSRASLSLSTKCFLMRQIWHLAMTC